MHRIVRFYQQNSILCDTHVVLVIMIQEKTIANTKEHLFRKNKQLSWFQLLHISIPYI